MMASYQIAFSQQDTFKSILDCQNYNSFRFNENNGQLKYYANEIQSNGLMDFNLSRMKDINVNNFQPILALMNVSPQNTFILEMESIDPFDNQRKTLRYQQYYKGVSVEGGGYALTTTTDPCPKGLMMSPFIASNIALNVLPQLSSTAAKSNIMSQLNIPIEKIQNELVVTQNILNDCVYRLAWRNTCTANGGSIVWVDANNGAILKQRKSDIYINAPTINYGNLVMLNDKTTNGVTKLETPSGDIVAYDFTNQDCSAINEPSQFLPSAVPQTPNINWTIEADKSVYQTFYVTGLVAAGYKSLGINFKKINIGSGCNDPKSEETKFLGLSPPNGDTYIVTGTIGGKSVATFDVIAHELLHSYLQQQMKIYTSYPQQGALHEGLADIFGTYMEYLYQKSKGGGIDWIIGDDAGVTVRDMKKPKFKCYQSALALSTDYHEIGAPLGYWFYLITEGDANQGIPALGIEKAMEILLSAVKMLPNGNVNMNDDLRKLTLEIAKQKFGPCSSELRAIGKAWNAIMCGSKYVPFVDDCYFAIKGPWIVCEELGKISQEIEAYNPVKAYRWYFPMGWVVSKSQGNSLNIPPNSPVSGVLEVTGFPKYPYYPQLLEVELYSITDGITRKKTIKLIDCNNDDPTDPCAPVAQKVSKDSSKDIGIAKQVNEKTAYETTKVKVFDTMGRVIFEGNEAEIPNFFPSYGNQLLIYTYFDEQGNFIKSTKKMNIL